MAKVNQRLWKIPGQRTKRKAWGFSTVINGKRVRSYRAEWSRDDAEDALSKARLNIEPAQPKAGGGLTFGEAIEKYLGVKARKKSLAHDRLYLGQLRKYFGADTLLSDITASRIDDWKAEKLSMVCKRTGEPLAAATINRPLAALRHLLRLATKWGLAAAPEIGLEDEPEGKIVWLEPDEETRLLRACAKSKNAELTSIVTVALETGMRRGELLGVTWDRVDLSRGVIQLAGRGTKSGKGRDIPMRQAVYNILAALPAEKPARREPALALPCAEPARREGRVFKTRSVRTAFENAVETAGLQEMARLDGKPFTFHGCRHHFASWFVMRGGSLPALQKILGHADLKMTLRYAHLAPAYLRDEIARTERPAAGPANEPARVQAQGMAQEPVAAVRSLESAL